MFKVSGPIQHKKGDVSRAGGSTLLVLMLLLGGIEAESCHTMVHPSDKLRPVPITRFCAIPRG